QSLRAHHADVHPSNCQDAGAAIGRCGNVATFASAVTVIGVIPTWRAFSMLCFAKQDSSRLRIDNEFSRKVGREMSGHTNRSYTWAAAAVRDAKRFVQI